MEVKSISIKEFPKYESVYNNAINRSVSIFKNMTFATDVGKEISNELVNRINSFINRVESFNKITAKLDDIDKSIELEAGIFEFVLFYIALKNLPEELTTGVYNDKLCDLLVNLDKHSSVENKYLKKKILSGDLLPQAVPFMSPQQIHPKRWKLLEKKKKLREYKKSHMAATDLYTCYKCGESKCKITQMQTRGADEPITNFITCLVCHNTFKQ